MISQCAEPLSSVHGGGGGGGAAGGGGGAVGGGLAGGGRRHHGQPGLLRGGRVRPGAGGGGEAGRERQGWPVLGASYIIDQASANTGSIINRATAIASSPGQTDDVTDQSDDPNTAAANDATVVSITPSPAMEVTKTVAVIENGDGFLGIGDTVKYTIAIENQGNVPLTSIVITDTFTDLGGNAMTLTRHRPLILQI